MWFGCVCCLVACVFAGWYIWFGLDVWFWYSFWVCFGWWFLITFLFGFDIVAVCRLFWARVLLCFCDLLMGFVLCGFGII